MVDVICMCLLDLWGARAENYNVLLGSRSSQVEKAHANETNHDILWAYTLLKKSSPQKNMTAVYSGI